MNEWENNPCPEPVDGKPNGQKCKYKVNDKISIWKTIYNPTRILRNQ